MEAPVARAAPVPFRSKVEMYEEISQLRPFLSCNTELDLRIKALQRLEAVMVGAAKAGAGGLDSALQPLVEDLQSAFMDGRFRIVNQLCHLMTVLAESMGSAFEPVAEALFLDLLKVLSLSAAFSTAAHTAIAAILSECFPMAFLDAILVEVRESRSTTVRIRCAEYVRKTLMEWGMRPDQPLAEAQGDLEAFIKSGIEDTAREVRSEARHCFRLYCRLWPDRESTLRGSFDPSVLKVLAHEDKAMAYARRQIQEQHSQQHQLPSAQPSTPRGPQSPQRPRSPQPILSKGAVNAADLASLQAAAAQRMRSSISPGSLSQRTGSPGGEGTSTTSALGPTDAKESAGHTGRGASQSQALSPGASIFQDLESQPSRSVEGLGPWAVSRITGQRLQAEGVSSSGHMQVQVQQTQSQVEDTARVLPLEEAQQLGQSRTVTSTSLPGPDSSEDFHVDAPAQDTEGRAPLREATEPGENSTIDEEATGQEESPGGPKQAGTSPRTAGASRWKGGARDLLAAAKENLMSRSWRGEKGGRDAGAERPQTGEEWNRANGTPPGSPGMGNAHEEGAEGSPSGAPAANQAASSPAESSPSSRPRDQSPGRRSPGTGGGSFKEGSPEERAGQRWREGLEVPSFKLDSLIPSKLRDRSPNSRVLVLGRRRTAVAASEAKVGSPSGGLRALMMSPRGMDGAAAKRAKPDTAVGAASPRFGRALSASGSPGGGSIRSGAGQGQGRNVWEDIPGPPTASQSELEDTGSTTTASSVAVSEQSRVKRSTSARIGEALLGSRRATWRGSPEVEKAGAAKGFAPGVPSPKAGAESPSSASGSVGSRRFRAAGTVRKLLASPTKELGLGRRASGIPTLPMTALAPQVSEAATPAGQAEGEGAPENEASDAVSGLTSESLGAPQAPRRERLPGGVPDSRQVRRDSSPSASSTTSTRSRSHALASPSSARGGASSLRGGASSGRVPQMRDMSPSASSTTSTASRTRQPVASTASLARLSTPKGMPTTKVTAAREAGRSLPKESTKVGPGSAREGPLASTSTRGGGLTSARGGGMTSTRGGGLPSTRGPLPSASSQPRVNAPGKGAAPSSRLRDSSPSASSATSAASRGARSYTSRGASSLGAPASGIPSAARGTASRPAPAPARPAAAPAKPSTRDWSPSTASTISTTSTRSRGRLTGPSSVPSRDSARQPYQPMRQRGGAPGALPPSVEEEGMRPLDKSWSGKESLQSVESSANVETLSAASSRDGPRPLRGAPGAGKGLPSASPGTKARTMDAPRSRLPAPRGSLRTPTNGFSSDTASSAGASSLSSRSQARNQTTSTSAYSRAPPSTPPAHHRGSAASQLGASPAGLARGRGERVGAPDMPGSRAGAGGGGTGPSSRKALSVGDVLRKPGGAQRREDWSQKVQTLGALQGLLRTATGTSEGAAKVATDISKNLQAIVDAVSSGLEVQHHKVTAAALACLKDLLGFSSGTELSSIFPEKWLPSVLGRAADVAQPSARQQALSILDLMGDCFKQEMLLGALERILARLRTSRAKAKAIEYGTSIVQACPDLQRPGSSYDGAPGSMGKAVRAWGTRLMQTVADAKYRQEAMAGVVACAGSIGPQFIVSHLETMQPASSQQILITLGKASPSLCRRVMQGLLQSRDMLSPELVVAMQSPGGTPRAHHRGGGPASPSALSQGSPSPGKLTHLSLAEGERRGSEENQVPASWDSAWLSLFSDVVQALQASPTRSGVPSISPFSNTGAASSCSASVLSLDPSQAQEDNETDTTSIGYALSPSRPLHSNPLWGSAAGGGHTGGALPGRSPAPASGAPSFRPKLQAAVGGVAGDSADAAAVERGGDAASPFLPMDDESVKDAAARIFGYFCQLEKGAGLGKSLETLEENEATG